MSRHARRSGEATPTINRDVARLAVPAFFTLIAEPLFLLTDSAIVGHLGTTALAALGAASTILLALTGIFVFLAYATTAVVARHVGAGREDDAVDAGLDGVWLALAIGIPLALLSALLAPPATRAMASDAAPAVTDAAVTYLRISALGIPAMLLLLAAQGLLRGLQDTRTPLWVTAGGFTVNAGLNAALVLGAHQGIAGSALGTVIAQWLMAAVMMATILRRTRHLDLRPHPARVLAAARFGVPLLVRTLALRAVLLLTTATAARFGATTLAAHQVASTLFTFLTFALDAVAIAAQALIGQALGRGDMTATRRLTDVMVRWGLLSGALAGVLLLGGAGALPALFSSDGAVRHATTYALVVIALAQPAAGVLFVLDGVLMGAGDGVYLARTQVALLAAYLPVVGALLWTRHDLAASAWLGGALPLVAVWGAYCLYLCARCLVLLRRSRSTAWMGHSVP